jgi:hypothetical protein
MGVVAIIRYPDFTTEVRNHREKKTRKESLTGWQDSQDER